MRLAGLIARIGCRWFGHEWTEHDGNTMKRRCIQCKRVEWVFGREHPRIGEPKYEWREMPSEPAFLRAAEKRVKP